MQHFSAWALFTRLGEAQILLPAMVAAMLWLWRQPATRPLALAWVGATAAAALLTTASKIAFIGYTVGYAPLDYTGISGHAMFAACVLPVLARIGAGRAAAPWPRVAIGVGFVLAAAVAVSRVVVHAHSPVESLLGFVAGGAASAWALRRTQAPRAPTPAWLLVAALAWFVALPAGAPASRTHDWVTALSLQVSGRDQPYTRWEMHNRAAASVHGSAPAARHDSARAWGRNHGAAAEHDSATASGRKGDAAWRHIHATAAEPDGAAARGRNSAQARGHVDARALEHDSAAAR